MKLGNFYQQVKPLRSSIEWMAKNNDYEEWEMLFDRTLIRLVLSKTYESLDDRKDIRSWFFRACKFNILKYHRNRRLEERRTVQLYEEEYPVYDNTIDRIFLDELMSPLTNSERFLLLERYAYRSSPKQLSDEYFKEFGILHTPRYLKELSRSILKTVQLDYTG